MFGKKLTNASYNPSIFSLCCGFVGKGRKNSDDDVTPKGGAENNDEKEEEKKPGHDDVMTCSDDDMSDKASKNVKSKDVGGDGIELDGEVIESKINGKSINGSENNIPENGDVPMKALEQLLSDSIAKITKRDDESLGNDRTDSSNVEKATLSNGVNELKLNHDQSIKKNGDCKNKIDVEKTDDDEGKGTDEEMIKKEQKEKKKGKKKGTAYQYDDESSSGDSDDEVLKHYKENLVRSASMRSAKGSSRTRASDAGMRRSSKAGSANDTETIMEQGDAASKLSYNAETDDGRHPSPYAETPNSDSPSRGGSRTFDNKAFLGDKAQSLSESEQAQSTDQLNSDEHLFDVSDLQNEPPLISKCGSLEVSFRYDNANSRMVVVIHQGREIPSKDRGGANSTQVRVMLLPNKKQRHKSKVKMGDNPLFGEKIYFNKILPDEIPNMGLRFRLYGLERMRRERMIGESIVGFASLNMEQETTHWVVLEPRSNLTGDSGFDVSSLSRSDSASSTQSLQHGGMPELLMGLSYNGTTGRLSVEAIKGSNFRNMAMNRAPDTYVKLSLMNSNGQEVQHCKTSVRRGQPNPLFKETFMLQVALFQLPEVTLMVSVYNKKSMKKKEMIGWYSLGMNSSGEEEASHWTDMRESKGEQVCRWHVLLES